MGKPSALGARVQAREAEGEGRAGRLAVDGKAVAALDGVLGVGRPLRPAADKVAQAGEAGVLHCGEGKGGVVAGTGVDDGALDVVGGEAGVEKHFADFARGLPGAQAIVVEKALRHIDGTGDVAGLEVQVFATASKTVASAGINEQAIVIAHVIDGGHGHMAGVDRCVGTYGEIAGAGQRGIAQVAPIGQTAVEDANVLQASPAQGPPGAACEKAAAFVIDHDGAILADSPLTEVFLELIRIRQRVAAYLRAGQAGERIGGIAKQRRRNVQGGELVIALAQLGLPVGGQEGESLAVINGFAEFLWGDQNAHAPEFRGMSTFWRGGR